MQTAAESDSLLLDNLFGFWSWFTWFMPFLNPAEEKEEADLSASSIAAAITASTPEDIRLQKEFYAQMVFTGIHMPFMFEGAIIKLVDFSPEEWIAHHYHEHLCKAIESDPLAILAIEQLEILTTEQIRGLYYHIINGRFVN